MEAPEGDADKEKASVEPQIALEQLFKRQVLWKDALKSGLRKLQRKMAAQSHVWRRMMNLRLPIDSISISMPCLNQQAAITKVMSDEPLGGQLQQQEDGLEPLQKQVNTEQSQPQAWHLLRAWNLQHSLSTVNKHNSCTQHLAPRTGWCAAAWSFCRNKLLLNSACPRLTWNHCGCSLLYLPC